MEERWRVIAARGITDTATALQLVAGIADALVRAGQIDAGSAAARFVDAFVDVCLSGTLAGVNK